MKFKIFFLFFFLIFLIFVTCQRKNGSQIYEMNIYFLEGNKLNQAQVFPLFPGETSVQFIQKVFENSEDIKHQLNQIFGYQFIQLLDANTITFRTDEPLTEIIKLNPSSLLRIYFLPNGKTDPIPVSLALFHLIGEVEIPSHFVPGSGLAEFEQRLGIAPFFSVRADIPLNEGIILGRPFPDSEKAFFLVLQPITVQEPTETEKDRLFRGGDKPPTIAELDSNIAPYDSLDKKPALLKKVNPIYPEEARKSGKEGMVFLTILINEEGKVIETWLKKSSEIPSLDNAAIEAVKQFEFSPGENNGQQVKVKMIIPFNFKLNKI